MNCPAPIYFVLQDGRNCWRCVYLYFHGSTGTKLMIFQRFLQPADYHLIPFCCIYNDLAAIIGNEICINPSWIGTGSVYFLDKNIGLMFRSFVTVACGAISLRFHSLIIRNQLSFFQCSEGDANDWVHWSMLIECVLCCYCLDCGKCCTHGQLSSNESSIKHRCLQAFLFTMLVRSVSAIKTVHGLLLSGDPEMHLHWWYHWIHWSRLGRFHQENMVCNQ